jgi:hypothetical protein
VAWLGIVFRFMAIRTCEIERYNRWGEFAVTAGPSTPGSM